MVVEKIADIHTHIHAYIMKKKEHCKKKKILNCNTLRINFKSET